MNVLEIEKLSKLLKHLINKVILNICERNPISLYL
jgi:hypothetical protein